jgi:hypothetical protein
MQSVSGPTNVTVDSTSGFPANGWIRIANGPLYSYQGKTPTSFLLVTGVSWQYPSGTTVTFYQAANPFPTSVGEYRNEGVGNPATLAVPGQKGDVVILVLCVTEVTGGVSLVEQHPPLRTQNATSSGWLHLSGVNGVRFIQSAYRFMADRTQVFSWTVDRSVLWRFDAIVYRGMGAIPRYGTGFSTGDAGSYAYSEYLDTHRSLDIVGAKSSGSTIVYPDPDPGVMTSFQDFGPIPSYFYTTGQYDPYTLDLAAPGNNWYAVQPGDFLLLQAWAPTANAITLPSGWTSLYSNTDPRCLVAYKVWQTGDPTTIGSLGPGTQVDITIYRGVHPTNPIDAVQGMSPAEGSPESDPITVSYNNARLIQTLFLTTTVTNFYVDNPSYGLGTYGSYQDRGYVSRLGLGSYGQIRFATIDRLAWIGTPFAPVWTWGNGQQLSSLSASTAQVAISLRPAVPAVAQGPRKPTVAFFERNPLDARSYIVEDESGGYPAGSWLVASLAIAGPDAELPFGPMMDATQASIVVAITGLENYHGSSVQDGMLRDVWLATYPESARPFLSAFPDSPVPENCAALMFLDDEGNLVAVHPYAKGRDTWGYGPAVSPDGQTFCVPGWFGDMDLVCMNIAGDVLWSLANFGIDTPPVYSADGTLIYAIAAYSRRNMMVVLDAETGDFVSDVVLSDQTVSTPWNSMVVPDGVLASDGLLIGAVYDNSHPAGIYTTDPITGLYEPWLLWGDIEDQLPFTRIGSNPIVQGNWGLDVHPGGDGLVVAVRHAYPIGALVEISWDKVVTNTYQLGSWARVGNFADEMIECCYSRDGNYLYATDDLGGLLFRFERGPGSIGGDAPFMNLSYVSRAEWEADGFPDGHIFSQSDDHAAFAPSTTGVVTRVPSISRPSNVVIRKSQNLRARW